jgi:predicted HD superfamily hydrolase involved in NAD metabolism
MAAALAQRHGVDPEQARLAALLHDCGRGVDKGSLTHAITGERIAREEYGVTDEAVLQAIRRHTTLGIRATKLDKLIYLADMVEYGRRYDGVDELRRLAMENIDAACVNGLTDTILYVREKGLEVHSDSINALYELGGSLPLNQ